MDDRFDGKGFDKSPIEGDEAAKHRHMFKDVSEQWLSLDSAATLVRAISILASVIRVAGPVGLLAVGAGAFAKTQGWI